MAADVSSIQLVITWKGQNVFKLQAQEVRVVHIQVIFDQAVEKFTFPSLYDSNGPSYSRQFKFSNLTAEKLKNLKLFDIWYPDLKQKDKPIDIQYSKMGIQNEIILEADKETMSVKGTHLAIDSPKKDPFENKGELAAVKDLCAGDELIFFKAHMFQVFKDFCIAPMVFLLDAFEKKVGFRFEAAFKSEQHAMICLRLELQSKIKESALTTHKIKLLALINQVTNGKLDAFEQHKMTCRLIKCYLEALGQGFFKGVFKTYLKSLLKQDVPFGDNFCLLFEQSCMETVNSGSVRQGFFTEAAVNDLSQVIACQLIPVIGQQLLKFVEQNALKLCKFKENQDIHSATRAIAHEINKIQPETLKMLHAKMKSLQGSPYQRFIQEEFAKECLRHLTKKNFVSMMQMYLFDCLETPISAELGQLIKKIAQEFSDLVEAFQDSPYVV